MPPRRAAAAAAASRVKYAESDDDDGGASSGGDSGSDFAADGEHGGVPDENGEDDDEEDEEDDDGPSSEEDTKKRKRATKTKPAAAKRSSNGKSAAAAAPTKKAKKMRADSGGDDDSDADLGDITSVTKLAPAPKDVHQQGKLGKPVIEFMTRLADPKYNDREWFQANEKVWKWVKQDFEDFTGNFLEALMEDVDETVPYLPVKDMVYRIYRDVRFSNDKTPYKRTLMSTFSRGGRKGPFAGYHLCIRAGGESALHAGLWDPPTEHLAALRTDILNDGDGIKQLKEIIERDEFVEFFGPSRPDPKKGVVGSLWHHEPLKKAPKGVDKDHPDIDLLRLKSYCITRRFTDDEVHQDDFKQKLVETAKVAKDFVHCINDIVHPS